MDIDVIDAPDRDPLARRSSGSPSRWTRTPAPPYGTFWSSSRSCGTAQSSKSQRRGFSPSAERRT
ncbi:hypothetical protein ACFVZJ_11325 [Streptomyces sp. NPDC058322]|uniref:hypothetical protein n=1 Tax=unclassified Streptomyces TaxID=2593676 RepID=UPI0036E3F3D8